MRFVHQKQTFATYGGGDTRGTPDTINRHASQIKGQRVIYSLNTALKVPWTTVSLPPALLVCGGRVAPTLSIKAGAPRPPRPLGDTRVVVSVTRSPKGYGRSDNQTSTEHRQRHCHRRRSL